MTEINQLKTSQPNQPNGTNSGNKLDDNEKSSKKFDKGGEKLGEGKNNLISLSVEEENTPSVESDEEETVKTNRSAVGPVNGISYQRIYCVYLILKFHNKNGWKVREECKEDIDVIDEEGMEKLYQTKYYTDPLNIRRSDTDVMTVFESNYNNKKAIEINIVAGKNDLNKDKIFGKTVNVFNALKEEDDYATIHKWMSLIKSNLNVPECREERKFIEDIKIKDNSEIKKSIKKIISANKANIESANKNNGKKKKSKKINVKKLKRDNKFLNWLLDASGDDIKSFYKKVEFKEGETFDELDTEIANFISSNDMFKEFTGVVDNMSESYKGFKIKHIYLLIWDKIIKNMSNNKNKIMAIKDVLESILKESSNYKTEDDVLKLFLNNYNYVLKMSGSVGGTHKVDTIIRYLENRKGDVNIDFHYLIHHFVKSNDNYSTFRFIFELTRVLEMEKTVFTDTKTFGFFSRMCDNYENSDWTSKSELKYPSLNEIELRYNNIIKKKEVKQKKSFKNKGKKKHVVLV